MHLVRRSALLASLFSLACGGTPAHTGSSSGGGSGADAPPHAAAADVQTFAHASNQLGLEIFGRLGADGNLAISPASIATALAMTYGGARGASASEMARTMHVSTSPDETLRVAGSLVRDWNDESRTAYELAVANRLFGERTYRFAPAFLTATRDELGAELEPVDFASAPEPARIGINTWVSDRTHARIPEILPSGSVDSDTRLVLVNAVYFHGSWRERFDEADTRDLPFHTASGEDAIVPTMTAMREGYGADDTVQVLELPYAGGEVSMMFVLPRAQDGLASVEAQLSADRVEAWHALVNGGEPVAVHVPRFRIETDAMSLRPSLIELGMGSLFTSGADLSGMSASGASELFLSDVFHRVFVELNEEGTEAAAATAVVAQIESTAASEPTYFVADHPFLFFLRDQRTGAVLFAGRVVDPR
jgi:serine protease inhibitor